MKEDYIKKHLRLITIELEAKRKRLDSYNQRKKK